MKRINRKNDGKLKVGIISDTFWPDIGGGENHVMNLAKFLKDDGNEVEILTDTSIGETSWLGIKVKRLDKNRSKFKRLFSDFRDVFKFAKRFDVIHCHYTFYLSSVAGIACLLLKKPVVVTLHGLGTLDSSVNKYFRRRIFRWLSFKLADAVIGTSQEMVDVAQRFVNKEKIFYITNGVDTNYFHQENAGDGKNKNIVVLSMRRLNPKNGVQYLVEAIPYILKEKKDIEFWISGKDRIFEYLNNRVKELNIIDNVKFVGDIIPEKTKEYYNQADIIVFPSSAESTSIACLEAMSMKRAVIASALEPFRLMLGENRGLLVKLFDRETSDYDAPLSLPEEKIKLLARAIIFLSENEQKRIELGEEARRFVQKNFDWNVLIKKIEEVYCYASNKYEK